MTDAFPPPPSGPDSPVTEAELHAYADRQLTAERHAEVTAWLARRPGESSRVRAWEDQKHALRGLFDPVLDEAVPPALQRHARGRAAGWRRPVLAAAASLLLALAAGSAGWALRGAHDDTTVAVAPPPATDFAARAAIAHAVYSPEVKRPVEVDGAHEDQLVTWLSRRMGAPMKAPHLQSLGYELEGGRLLPGDRGPVAQFMYRDTAGHRLTLYVSNEKPAATKGLANADPRAGDAPRVDTAFRFVSEGPVNVFWWMDGPFRYAITAAADRAALTQVSAEVWRQLAPQRP